MDTLRPVKQLVLRKGRPQIVDMPPPGPRPGFVLVETAASAISSGTERGNVASGGSLPMRAIRNPQLVRQTLGFAREHGVRKTAALVRDATGADLPLGYSVAGVVRDSGGTGMVRVGDTVACAGAGYANHAELVSVPGNLVTVVPPGVPVEHAAFTTIGAIALHGVRRAGAALGERVVVTGLGLLGLITVQLLAASGCRVLGIEPRGRRRELAVELGAEEAIEPSQAPGAVDAWTGGVGADVVLVTASSNAAGLVDESVQLLRRKGRLVAVGDVPLHFDRAPLYEREADVQISTSYGPGRYDPLYEEGGLDYPLAYVRWTENRNMDEFLRLVAGGAVRLEPLVDRTVPFEEAPDVYEALIGDDPPLGAVLTYAGGEPVREIARASRPSTERTDRVEVALVGVGCVRAQRASSRTCARATTSPCGWS